MSSCPFCLRADRPMTREHVFAHWLIAKTHGARLMPSRAIRDETRLSRVIAPVCADCNAGWMSSLEVSFRRLVFARTRSGPIAQPDRTALARWFTKTAALVAHARGLALVDAGSLPALRDGMPADVEVYIARRRRPPQLLDYGLTQEDGLVRVVSLTVDDLVACVAGPRRLDARNGTRLWPLRTHALRWDTLPVLSGAASSAV